MVRVTIGKRASWNNVGRGAENVFVLKYRFSLLWAERHHENKLRISTFINHGIMVVLTYRISLPDTERHHETKTTKSNMANLLKNDVKTIESGSLRPMFTINTKD